MGKAPVRGADGWTNSLAGAMQKGLCALLAQRPFRALSALNGRKIACAIPRSPPAKETCDTSILRRSLKRLFGFIRRRPDVEAGASTKPLVRRPAEPCLPEDQPKHRDATGKQQSQTHNTPGTWRV